MSSKRFETLFTELFSQPHLPCSKIEIISNLFLQTIFLIIKICYS